jgi:carboxymethylenebutenolidase
VLGLRITVALLTLLLARGLVAQERPGDDERDRTTTGWTGVLDEEEFAALHELTGEKAPPRRGIDVRLRVSRDGDGEAAANDGPRAYLSLPKSDPKAGIVVIHEWWGLNEHIEHWADRLAADGYAALAVDLYGGVVATDRDGAMQAMQGVDEDAALATLRAAHDFLRSDERVQAERTGVIGWCFGGGWSLRLAIAEPDLDAAVVYYGRLVNDEDTLRAIRAPVLGVFGDEDRGIPPEAVDAFAAGMARAGRPLTLCRYDAEHAFANPSSARYDAENAASAWANVRTFLREHLVEPEGRFGDRSRQLRSTLPEGWTEQEGERPMRAATYSVPGGLECAVFVLGGDGGGVRANLDRWRGQLGLAPLGDEELAALARLPVLGRDSVSVRFEGSFTGGMGGDPIDDAVMLAVVCEMPEEAVFVRLVGERGKVDAQRAAFESFCLSLR